uniref:Uncharacterized protein n=1 Tax=Solanum tuberosum TaxID=4113 RepID=M1DWF2_SOLTU
MNPSFIPIHSARESEWAKAEAVLHAASGCPRGTHLIRTSAATIASTILSTSWVAKKEFAAVYNLRLYEGMVGSMGILRLGMAFLLSFLSLVSSAIFLFLLKSLALACRGGMSLSATFGFPISAKASREGRNYLSRAGECRDRRCQLIAFSVFPLASSHSGSLGGTVLLRGIDRRLADCLFPRRLIHFPSRLRVLEQRVVHVVSATCQVELGEPQDSISCSFQPYLLRVAPKCLCFH